MDKRAVSSSSPAGQAKRRGAALRCDALWRAPQTAGLSLPNGAPEGLNLTLTVPYACGIWRLTDISVSVTLMHPYAADVSMRLRAPSPLSTAATGSGLALCSGAGGSNSYNGTYRVSDTAAVSIAAIAPAPNTTLLRTGTYRPHTNLSTLLPSAASPFVPMAGSAWGLQLVDGPRSNATGAVYAWSLTIWAAQPAAPAPSTSAAPSQAALASEAEAALPTSTPAPQGRLEMSIMHRTDEMTWFIQRLNDSASFQLPGQPRAAATNLTLPAGALVNLTCSLAAPFRCGVVSGVSLMLSPNRPPSLAANVSVSLLVMILSLSDSDECLGAGGADAARVGGVLWDPEQGVAAQLAACSFGRFRLLRNSSLVVHVPLPCSLDVIACNTLATANAAKQAYAALSAQQAGLLPSLRRFSHVAYVMPEDTLCSWAGLASLAGGESWLAPRELGVYKPGTMMQELLHNFGMHHGWRDGTEYMDFSTVMGSAHRSCPSAPELLRLGWAAPGVTLNASSLALASTRAGLALNATILGPYGIMIRILPDWLGAAYIRNLYLSLRVRGGPDAQLDAEYGYKISVHEALRSVDNAPPSPQADPRFNLIALVDAGQQLQLPEYGLLVQARELIDGGTRMAVDVCRYRYNASLECALPPVPTICPIVDGYSVRRDLDSALPSAGNHLGVSLSLGALASFCANEPRGCAGFSWDTGLQVGYWKAAVSPTQAVLGSCLYSRILPPTRDSRSKPAEPVAANAAAFPAFA
ncbi:hypothetical protein HYH03_007245 [Edaphochlamys debaryana]|nr:hypothetical protein HYH03_007245 [Edaphochlamys debaryana]|eukprot:KAG2494732.1 hypothetical protein HYH03_007245 [Edaphochlamys debaryana]